MRRGPRCPPVRARPRPRLVGVLLRTARSQGPAWSQPQLGGVASQPQRLSPRSQPQLGVASQAPLRRVGCEARAARPRSATQQVRDIPAPSPRDAENATAARSESQGCATLECMTGTLCGIDTEP